MARFAVLVVMLSFLAACSSAPATWNKPGFKQKEYAADWTSCLKDRTAQWGYPWLMNDATAVQCMRAKGYTIN